MFLPEFVCLSVCLCVSKITQKLMEGSFWNFEGMSGMATATSDSILGVIRKESWNLENFEIFVNIAWENAAKPNTVIPPGEQNGVGGGLRSLTAYYSYVLPASSWLAFGQLNKFHWCLSRFYCHLMCLCCRHELLCYVGWHCLCLVAVVFQMLLTLWLYRVICHSLSCPLLIVVCNQGGYVFAGVCLFVCLSVCYQDNSESYERIFLKFWGNVGRGKSYKWFNFGGDPAGILDSGSLWNFRYHCVKGGISEPRQNWRWWRHLANSFALAKVPALSECFL